MTADAVLIDIRTSQVVPKDTSILEDSSFAMQYNIRLREEADMTWSEFITLLTEIMAETSLGKIVSIRSEENKDMLKNFTP